MLNEAVGRAKEITAFAAQPANWYRIGESTWIPGNRPEYVLGAAGNIRAVFSFTWVSDDEVYRHLTISAPHSLPSPLFVWTLAHAFGFTGAEADPGTALHRQMRTGLVFLSLRRDDGSEGGNTPHGGHQPGRQDRAYHRWVWAEGKEVTQVSG